MRLKLDALFLYVGGMIMVQTGILTWQYSGMPAMHNAEFYRVVSIAMPIVLVAMAGASGCRWAATAVAAVYTGFWLGALWILPLFPAQPRLGPVYQQATHFVPLGFTLLLIVPAVLLDLSRTRVIACNSWLQAAILGSGFLISFVCAQWPFANFLLSPAARNWFFGSHYLAYGAYFDAEHPQDSFWPAEHTRAEFWLVMAMALVATILSTRLGIAWASWMRRVRR